LFTVDPKKDSDASSTEILPEVLDPACPVDDEDCLVISSYSSTPQLISDASLLKSLQRRSRYLAREPVLKVR